MTRLTICAALCVVSSAYVASKQEEVTPSAMTPDTTDVATLDAMTPNVAGVVREASDIDIPWTASASLPWMQNFMTLAEMCNSAKCARAADLLSTGACYSCTHVPASSLPPTEEEFWEYMVPPNPSADAIPSGEASETETVSEERWRRHGHHPHRHNRHSHNPHRHNPHGHNPHGHNPHRHQPNKIEIKTLKKIKGIFEDVGDCVHELLPGERRLPEVLNDLASAVSNGGLRKWILGSFVYPLLENALGNIDHKSDAFDEEMTAISSVNMVGADGDIDEAKGDEIASKLVPTMKKLSERGPFTCMKKYTTAVAETLQLLETAQPEHVVKEAVAFKQRRSKVSVADEEARETAAMARIVAKKTKQVVAPMMKKWAGLLLPMLPSGLASGTTCRADRESGDELFTLRSAFVTPIDTALASFGKGGLCLFLAPILDEVEGALKKALKSKRDALLEMAVTGSADACSSSMDNYEANIFKTSFKWLAVKVLKSAVDPLIPTVLNGIALKVKARLSLAAETTFQSTDGIAGLVPEVGGLISSLLTVPATPPIEMVINGVVFGIKDKLQTAVREAVDKGIRAVADKMLEAYDAKADDFDFELASDETNVDSILATFKPILKVAGLAIMPKIKYMVAHAKYEHQVVLSLLQTKLQCQGGVAMPTLQDKANIPEWTFKPGVKYSSGQIAATTALAVDRNVTASSVRKESVSEQMVGIRGSWGWATCEWDTDCDDDMCCTDWWTWSPSGGHTTKACANPHAVTRCYDATWQSGGCCDRSNGKHQCHLSACGKPY